MKDNRPITEEDLAGILEANGIGTLSIVSECGPQCTRYTITPVPGIKTSNIRAFFEDGNCPQLPSGIRFTTQQGSIAVEIPDTAREDIFLDSLLENGDIMCRCQPMALPLLLGLRVDREPEIVDLATMPNLLIAGASGQGKSQAIGCVIRSLVRVLSPEDLQLVLMSPKPDDLKKFCNSCRQYLSPFAHGAENGVVNTRTDAVGTLEAVATEMQDRCQRSGEMPYIVVIIDEYADFIYGRSTEARNFLRYILYLASNGRTAGIHLVMATQRLSRDVITPLIKANFPARLALKVPTREDSRVVLDIDGAEKLTGAGDALLALGYDIRRVQVPNLDSARKRP